MEKLALVRPSLGYSDRIEEFRARIKQADSAVLLTGGLNALSVPEWLKLIQKKTRPETCPEGLVPDSTFLCVREADDALVGMINIRHILNETLLQFGGHVGYSIHPAERRKGYGREQLRLGLFECAKLGINPVLLTCAPWNEASRRIILSHGGVFEDERTNREGKPFQRYWIHLTQA
jgi:predicted acetyltransferase